ncbi:hypothetical protein HAX54_033036 [Datura stramonium]|uniref:Uncharacterized protein n=1 Tax=Datura stramonium TaxID=4076 RepID=A0ABS8Y6P6_DATST|nr:hypothetical protein [Datura stramonium]
MTSRKQVLQMPYNHPFCPFPLMRTSWLIGLQTLEAPEYPFFHVPPLSLDQTGQKLLITQRMLQSFRCQPVGRDLTLSLLYEYAYKSTANPFEQDSCKLGSVVLEGY